MQTEIITALIGAAGSIVAAIVGAYATIKTHDGGDAASIARRRRYGGLLLGLGLLFAIASLITGFVFGASHENQRVDAERKIKITKLTSSYQSLIDSGVMMNKSYVIPASVMLVNLDKPRED